MKKFLAFFILIGLVFLTLVYSCGSSRGGHCDAYGSVQVNPENDIAEK
jgi:hypothetical protein